jgi:hypothetical protein
MVFSLPKLMTASHHLKNKGNSDIVLIPQPTDDPNDPLNWPRWKKWFAFISMLLLCQAGGWVVGGVGSAIVLLMDEFHTDLASTVRGVINWSVLLLGAGVCTVLWLIIDLPLGSGNFIFWHSSGLAFRVAITFRNTHLGGRSAQFQ